MTYDQAAQQFSDANEAHDIAFEAWRQAARRDDRKGMEFYDALCNDANRVMDESLKAMSA